MNKMKYDYKDAKEEYRELCRKNPIIPIFMQDWYLDAVCDSIDEWSVILVKKNNQITAAFPFCYVKKHGLWRIENPWQTPRMGIWIDYGERKTSSKKNSFLSEVIKEIVSNLPPFDYFKIVFDSKFTNWQEFYWQGFSQTTHYSYIIENQGDIDSVWKSIKSERRRLISKAEKEYAVCKNEKNKEEYWDFFEDSYKLRNRTIRYEKDKLFRLIDAISCHNRGEARYVLDENNDICAENIVIWDEERMYLMFTAHDNQKPQGVQALCIWDAVKEAHLKGKIFDFEGSMTEGIAKFYNSFQAKLEPYYVIFKYSRKYKLYDSVRTILKIIKSIFRKSGKL